DGRARARGHPATAVLPGAQPRLPLPADVARAVRAGDRLAPDRAQPLHDPDGQAERGGLVAGDGRPPRPVRERAPDRRRAGEAEGRARALSPPGALRQAAGTLRRARVRRLLADELLQAVLAEDLAD